MAIARRMDQARLTEPLTDAVDRLLDCLERDHHYRVETSPALREAVDLAYRAYCREKLARDELVSEFPDLSLRLNR